jgi:hypothetical protein
MRASLRSFHLARGDHLFVWRRYGVIPFQHHAIDIGDGEVVHFSDGNGGVAGPTGDADRFVVSRLDARELVRGGRDRLHVVRYRQYETTLEEIAVRAESQLGRQGYHLLYDNCEHFATWCVTGRPTSAQVDTAFCRASSVALKTTVAVAARVALKTSRWVKPWTLAADAVQFGTEAVGHHLGLSDPKVRKNTGRALGGVTAVGIGALGGPVGMAIAGGTWVLGEIGSEVTCRALAYDRQSRELKRARLAE